MTCQPAPKVPVSGVTSLVILIALLTPTPTMGGGQPPATPLFLPVVAYGSGGWSSQGSVETLSARCVSRFELLGTQTAEMTVTARPIVERLDVVGYVGDRQLPVLVDLFLDPLFLQAAEE